ncbi:DNA-directed DNA polymerase [Ranunculus cassubicifolius]
MATSNLPTEVAIEELPKAIVRRVVKEKLSNDGGDIIVHKDALSAFSESARIFIHYLSATANDVCRESKRQTINAEDVLKALEEIEFPEFIGPLRTALDDYRQKNASKKGALAKSKGESNSKKRKAEEEKQAEEQNEVEVEDSGEDVVEIPNEEEDTANADDD